MFTRGIVSPKDLQASEESLRTLREVGPATTGSDDTDNYLSRLVKYIPPDVIAFYIFLEGALVSAHSANEQVVAWIVFGVILAATPFYLKRQGVKKPIQLALSTIAFVVWAAAYNAPPFANFGYPAIYATIAMGLYTFLIPLVIP